MFLVYNRPSEACLCRTAASAKPHPWHYNLGKFDQVSTLQRSALVGCETTGAILVSMPCSQLFSDLDNYF